MSVMFVVRMHNKGKTKQTYKKLYAMIRYYIDRCLEQQEDC